MEINRSTEILSNLNKINMEIYEMAYASIGTDWCENSVCSGYSRIYIILDGCGKIRCNDSEVLLEPGNIYIIPSGLKFSYECEDYLEKLYFHVSVTLYNNYDLLSGLDKFIILKDAQEFISAFSECFEKNTVASLLKIKLLLHEIISTAIKSNAAFYTNIKHCSDFITKVLAFIENHLSAKLTIAEIADEMFVSVSKLQKTFKREIGVSVGKYINDSLMLLASREVRSEKSIKDISDMLGYCDQFYFSRRFSEHFGVSPLNYRKNRIL